MRRVALALGLILMALVCPARAHAQPAPASSSAPAASATAAASASAAPSPPAAPVSPPPPIAAQARGEIAVTALPGASAAAWPLATALYAVRGLRPTTLDEARARVLAGEPPAAGAPQDLRDLADTIAAVHGDDAPSRALLADIAHRVQASRLLVVRMEDGHPSARVFFAASATYDAASYAPDEGTPLAWKGAVESLARTYGPPPPPPSPPAPPSPPLAAPPLATHDEVLAATAPPASKAFWQKGWFWGAVGAAAFAAGAIFFATRDNGPSSIHLIVQVPH